MNKALFDARKEKDPSLTIAEAAKEMGISYGMLAMMETGKRKGSDRTKLKIAKFYKKSVEELFYTH